MENFAGGCIFRHVGGIVWIVSAITSSSAACLLERLVIKGVAMNEASVWQYIKAGMAGRWLATRLESSSGNGVPDVVFSMPNINGFLELKYIKEWPKRPDTKVKLPLRPEQKLWISTRGKMGGNVWVLCRIEDDFFLLNDTLAIAACEGWDKFEWARNCNLAWPRRVNYFDELYYCLKEGYDGN